MKAALEIAIHKWKTMANRGERALKLKGARSFILALVVYLTITKKDRIKASEEF
jgi:hypothetical protein